MSRVLRSGDVFEGYRIVRVLDEGGMGVVYEAEEVYSEDRVAVKCLLPRHSSRSDFTRRFQQECKTHPKLKHPNVVRMRRAGVSADKVPFLVMDLLEGITLRKVLDRHGRLDVLNTLYLMAQVADAMQYAHAKGISHRDLKHENIMVGTRGEEKGHVWVLDFGIAKMAQGGMSTEELPGLGTARYMAPEQARAVVGSGKSGRRVKADHRVDIYGFGVIFYEVLTGRHTFIRDTGPASPMSFEEILAGHLTAEPVPAYELVDCPRAVWRMVTRCIAIDPDARYGRFDEIAMELREVCRDLMPKEHRLTRHLEEEEARSARRAAFEDVAREAVSEEVVRETLRERETRPEVGRAAGFGEAAGEEASMRVVGRAQAVSRVQMTAPLEGFVPKASPLPFAIKAPTEGYSGRGVGYTVRLPKLATPEEPEANVAMPASSSATLPVGRGRGHTMKIPKEFLPSPSPSPEAATGFEPRNRTETGAPASRTKTLEPSRMPAVVWIVAFMSAFGMLISSGVALFLFMNRASWQSPPPPAPAPSEADAPGVSAVSPAVASAPAPAEGSAPAAAEGSASAAVPVLGAPSAPIVEAPRTPVKPKRAPVSGAAAAKAPKIKEHGPLIDFEDAPASKPSGRR